MSLRLRYLKKSSTIYFSLAGLLCIVVAAWALLPKQSAHAAWYGQAKPSVLCAPNTCNTDEALDSIQDVKIQYADSAWQTKNNYSAGSNVFGDANRQVLEIADQSNHYMKEVRVGVYVSTSVYDNMPGNAMKLTFTNQDCDVSGTPNWTISIVGGATLATYDASSGANDRRKFCSSGDVSFDLSQQKAAFKDYANGAWKYIQISIKMTNFTGNRSDDRRSVRFQMRLTDVCGADVSCREYLALVASDPDADDSRNFALSTKGAVQDKVSNSGESGYQYFNKDNHSHTQDAVRQYMEFGLDCNVNTAQSKKVHIYDLNDGDAGSDTDNHGWVGGKDIVAVVLQYFDVSSGQWKNVAASYDGAIKWRDSSNTLHTGAWKDASGNVIAVEDKKNSTVKEGTSDGSDNASTSIDFDNHRLYALNDGDWPSVIYLPENGDRFDTRITFTMQPDVRYRIAITPDHPNNFVAVGLPGDQIFGLVGCRSFGLTPSVSGGTTVAASAAAKFDNKITSASDSLTDATGVAWESYGFVTRDGSETSKAGDYDDLNTICSGLTWCSSIGSGSGESVPAGGETILASTQYSHAGLHYGDKVCSFLAISPYQSDPLKTWRVSATKCYTVTKTPRLQVWGNDTRVGSGFIPTGTVTTSLINTNKGSWGEYGVLAPKGITTFGSGASSSGTNLTFANTPTVGSFTTSASVLGTIPAVQSYLVKAGNAPYKAKTGINTYDKRSDNITIATYEANAVYITMGKVTISNDITNPSTGANLSQMVIIAGDIVIDPNVKQVDAWLIASGMINTCSAAGSPTVTNCGGSQLTINGPIMAKQLLLRRTGGDDADQNSPAETFNLRGDAYIWMRKLSGLTGTVRTVYTRELAPRY